MNTKEYIASGILELYVLGALTAEEHAACTSMIESHPEVAEALSKIEADLMQVAESNAPMSLNKDILSGALSEIENSSKKEVKEIPLQANKSATPKGGSNKFLNVALIAASVALLFSLGLNYNFYQNLQETKNQLAELQNQNSVFADDLEIQTTRFEDTKNQLLALSDPNTVKISLNGIEGKEDALATVFWNQETKQTYINVNNLPEPPEGMQYQLWALADGVPIDAGVFDVSKEIQLTKLIDSAQTFAVTLEEAGGKPSPNLEQLFVIGNV